MVKKKKVILMIQLLRAFIFTGFFLQVELPDLGKLTKFRIWHEKRNPFAGWHLSKVSKY